MADNLQPIAERTAEQSRILLLEECLRRFLRHFPCGHTIPHYGCVACEADMALKAKGGFQVNTGNQPSDTPKPHVTDWANMDALLDAVETGSIQGSEVYHCPKCGYTPEDAAFHMDHHICEAKYGGPPMPKPAASPSQQVEGDGGESPAPKPCDCGNQPDCDCECEFCVGVEPIVLRAPFDTIRHARRWWVRSGGFRICAMLDIGCPRQYAEAIATLLQAGYDSLSATNAQTGSHLTNTPPVSASEAEIARLTEERDKLRGLLIEAHDAMIDYAMQVGRCCMCFRGGKHSDDCMTVKIRELVQSLEPSVKEGE
jgi:hypothetical protein